MKIPEISGILRENLRSNFAFLPPEKPPKNPRKTPIFTRIFPDFFSKKSTVCYWKLLFWAEKILHGDFPENPQKRG